MNTRNLNTKELRARCEFELIRWLKTGLVDYCYIGIKGWDNLSIIDKKIATSIAGDYSFVRWLNLHDEERTFTFATPAYRLCFPRERFIYLLRHFIEREIVEAWEETESLGMLEEGYGYDVEYITYKDMWNRYLPTIILPDKFIKDFLSSDALITELKEDMKGYSYTLLLDENGFKAVLTYFGEDE